ncbi:acylneuraminate cytidylyltransferase family protein [Litorivicinus sp.]|nr:acylneuraminate cytidylyltransferase family protein [Litorivicinus sp.]
MTESPDKLVAIIPARGGSTRVPGKNMRLLAGKPLIYWTIKAAKEANVFDLILVSTDSVAIADYAISIGASVPFLRDPALSTASTATSEVLIDILDKLSLVGQFKAIMLLQPTSPFRTHSDIINCVNLYRQNNCVAVYSVFESPDLSPLEIKPDREGKISASSAALQNTIQSQDFTNRYYLNGAIYLFDSQQFSIQQKILLTGDSYCYQMPIIRSLDIDEEDDMLVAEQFASKYLDGVCSKKW